MPEFNFFVLKEHTLKENRRSSEDQRLLPRRRMNETYKGIDPAERQKFNESENNLKKIYKFTQIPKH
jgi:hypothetical protein